ncbi:urease accessory protein UreD [Sporosarcina highlanderae]|uniref:Urease accessory protein UreD n=1 Tax=Sporosarcina highlanderae TaxID=3035916 RepID=A0ABT8JNP4_9BACL|nr:urease accessory protein UreD [Sporosarcina highlanderae]MDN4606657.1 urease accessory protein UreD [Sporosarcina highlanderae]
MLVSKTPRIRHHGKLEMVFEPRRGYTRMPHVFQQPPLKASRELYQGDDPTATVYVMESSGGMVAGDRNDITIELLPGSSARIIQQSALKVYRSHTGDTCVQTIDVKLAEEARLEWMPEVIIPFAEAKFQMETTIHLANNATLLWGEIIAPGREMRGEVFDFTSLKSKMKIYVEGELIAFDSLHFIPENMNFQELGMLEDALYVGSIWLVSDKADRLDLREIQEELNVGEGLRAGVTRLAGNAVHCRFLGVNQWRLMQEMKRVFSKLSALI